MHPFVISPIIMKKICFLLCAVFILFSLSGCKKSEPDYIQPLTEATGSVSEADNNGTVEKANQPVIESIKVNDWYFKAIDGQKIVKARHYVQ